MYVMLSSLYAMVECFYSLKSLCVCFLFQNSVSEPLLLFAMITWRASQVVLVVKNLPANSGDIRDTGSIPGWGRSPGGGHGNPFQYSCLENPMDRGAWRATSPWSCRVRHN